MTRYAAFLRGVNVGGHKLIKMADLRELCLEGGLLEVQTYIQSGNIVFSSPAQGGLAEKISLLIRAAYGFEVAVLVKDCAEMGRIIDANPLARDGGYEVKGLYATLLEAIPTENAVLAMARSGKVREKFAIIGDVVYTWYAQGYGKSDFSNNFIEKALGLRATTRNWTTMLALAQLTRA